MRIRLGEILVKRGILTSEQVHHLLDMQAQRARPFGQLAEMLFGVDPSKIEEAWVQQPYDHGLVARLTLCDDRNPDRALGVLVVCGRYAGFVERSTSENRMTLEAQLGAAVGDLERMREILDCEASYAVRPRAGTPYVIRHSNLPFREGRVLDVPVMDRRILDRQKTLPAQRDGAVWRVESGFVKG